MKQKLSIKERDQFNDLKKKAILKIGSKYATILKWHYPELRMCDIYRFNHTNSYDYNLLGKVIELAKSLK